jgi:colanic acid/amylovoran biosynthesis glycosyltransferase
MHPNRKLKVGVCRLQMFKPSEPFIAEQMAAMRNSDPVLIGRNLMGKPDARFNSMACEKIGRVASLELAILGRSASFTEAVRNLDLDILHAHFAVDALSALVLKRQLSLPLITTLHGFDVTTGNMDFIRSRRPALVRYGLFGSNLRARGDLFIAVSDFIANRAVSAGFPVDRIVRHYIGIDTNRFKPSDSAASSAESLNVLHVARLVEKKGTKYLIDAFSRVCGKYPNAVLNIVGDGPMLPMLREQANSTGIGSHVKFLGSVSHAEITRMMLEADVFILPSVTATNGDSEGLPIVILEASSCGLPIISTYHAGIPEAIVDGETGYLTKEHDVVALAEALDALLESPALREQLGAGGRKLMCGKFDIRRQAESLESIYRQVIL